MTNTLPPAILEIACFNSEGAIMAAQAGANRIELGEDYSCGGLTPTLSSLQAVQTQVQIPVHALIRNRPGDFYYDKSDLSTMVASVKLLAQANGFVFGALDNQGMPDEFACKTMLELAEGKPCIFHRAFDEINQKEKALEQLQRWGFYGLLTSGGKGGAWQNLPQLASLLNNISPGFQLMPGGGIRSVHLREMHLQLKASAYHSAALTADTLQPDPIEIQRLLQCLSDSSLPTSSSLL